LSVLAELKNWMKKTQPQVTAQNALGQSYQLFGEQLEQT